MTYQLAHLNIAQAKSGRFDPVMAGFFEAVDQINAAAEASDGFVWRLVDEATDPTWRTAFPEKHILTALSVWTDLDALRQYVYKSSHGDFLRRRREWFDRLTGPNLVLWWVPAGHRPSLGEARARLDALAQSGSGPEAFTFGKPFTAAGKPC
ncbi:MAG: DUF3291 domain-containing protein [Rhodothermales bacterium]|nr:DUF3291 domain-containing protein [Rhodothermales bacterium]